MNDQDNLVESIQQFMAVSGLQNEGDALNWLQMANFHVEEAINLFLANNSIETHSNPTQAFHEESQEYPATKRRNRVDALVDEEGRRIIPDDVKRQRLVDDPSTIMPHLERMDHYFRRGDVQTRPISRSVFGADGNYKPSTSKEATLNDLYAPPHKIMLHEDFLTAREIAKNEQKWLIININNHEDFACHVLNRDVWKDEGVQDLIKIGYIFWQQQLVAPEGAKYVERYKVTRYPYIAILDPRTGAVLWEKDTKINLDLICEKLTDYLYSNPYPTDPNASSRSRSNSIVGTNTSNSSNLSNSSSSNVPTFTSTSDSDRSSVPTSFEEDDIARAIALSLESSNHSTNITSSNKSISSSSSSFQPTQDSNERVNGSSSSSSSSSKSSNKRGFNMEQLLDKNTNHDNLNNNTNNNENSTAKGDEIKLQFRIPKNKKLFQSFSIHTDILQVAAFVAKELQVIGSEEENKKESFEMYLIYPRVALSVARETLLLVSSSDKGKDSKDTSKNLDDRDDDENTSVGNKLPINGIDEGGIVSLWSLGLTKDTAIAVEFI